MPGVKWRAALHIYRLYIDTLLGGRPRTAAEIREPNAYFTNIFEDGLLNLEPGFQRQSVWSERDRAKLFRLRSF